MSLIEIAMLLLAALFAMLGGGVWIALALLGTGLIAMTFFTSAPPGLVMATRVWGSAASWELSALPLFIWMGEILFRTKLSEEMFAGLAPWLTRVPGRLMHVNILGCGIFGSVSGSSAATAATIGKIALPELLKRGYDEKMILGSLAGAGTLGILIPPSIIMVVYAVAADVSIIQIFLAGMIPGLILMALMSGYIAAWALINPGRTPREDVRLTFWEKIKASRELIPCTLLIIGVIGALGVGYATATEAAAFGVVGALMIAAWSRTLTWQSFIDSAFGAMRASCMIMLILAGASYITVAMGFTGIPNALATWVMSFNPSPYMLIFILSIMYIVLGTALDGVSMIVLTTTVVLPMIQRAGFDLVWFGIFIVLVVEMAELSPPVGFNLFVLQNMSGRDSWFVAAASIPFFILMVITIVIITVLPDTVMWLPKLYVEAVK
jgi:tripartite ATP-independent transporter DctM subunit